MPTWATEGARPTGPSNRGSGKEPQIRHNKPRQVLQAYEHKLKRVPDAFLLCVTLFFTANP